MCLGSLCCYKTLLCPNFNCQAFHLRQSWIIHLYPVGCLVLYSTYFQQCTNILGSETDPSSTQLIQCFYVWKPHINFPKMHILSLWTYSSSHILPSHKTFLQRAFRKLAVELKVLILEQGLFFGHYCWQWCYCSSSYQFTLGLKFDGSQIVLQDQKQNYYISDSVWRLKLGITWSIWTKIQYKFSNFISNGWIRLA